MRPRASFAGAATAAAVSILLGVVASAHASVRPPGTVAAAIDVPAGRNVVAAMTFSASIARPRSAALVFAAPSVRDARRDRNATEALAALVRTLVPPALVTIEAAAPGPAPFGHYLGGPPYAGFVRVGVPADDDATLRAVLDQIFTAVGRLPSDSALVGTSLVRVDRRFASCAGLAADRASAIGIIESFSRSLAASDADANPMPPMIASAPATSTREPPSCSDNPGDAFPNVDTQPPTTAALSESYQTAVAQPTRFARVVAEASGIVPLRDAGAAWATLHLAATRPLLTVEGFAAYAPSRTGWLRYVYAGPKGTYDAATTSSSALDAIRLRLEALGIGERDVIVAQLAPTSRLPWVEVRTRSRVAPLAVARALAGDDPGELSAVSLAVEDDACEEAPAAARRAVADAAARAGRLAAALGTTIDPVPIAVSIEPAETADPCLPKDEPLAFATTLPRARPLAARDDAPSIEGVTVAFEMRAFPRVRSAAVPVAPEPTPAGVSPLPIGVASATGELSASGSVDLVPTSMRVSIDASPDNAHAFRAVDSGLAATFARELHLGSFGYAAAFVPNALRVGTAAEPPVLRFEATAPYAAANSTAVLTRVRDSAFAVAYSPIVVTAETSACGRAADDLATSVVRNALAKLDGVRDARPLAIDVRGPFVVAGGCGDGGSMPAYLVRTIPPLAVSVGTTVRIAYARTSRLAGRTLRR